MVNSTQQAILYEGIDRCIQNNEPFVIPTETVYGLAAPANDDEAVKRVYQIKNRPTDNPMICHFYSVDQIEQYIDTSKLPTYWRQLAEILSPGPITYFLPVAQDSELSPAIAGMSKVGCRIPNHKIALDIINKVGIPLAAPSANTSGRYSATSYEMVKADLADKVSCFVDGGESVIGIESTTIDCIYEDEIVIYRPGYVGKETIELALKSIGREDVTVRLFEGIPPDDVTPGMKYKHYQPVTDLIQIDRDSLNFMIAHYIGQTSDTSNQRELCLNFTKAREGDIATRDCLNFIGAGELVAQAESEILMQSDWCLLLITNKDYSVLDNTVHMPLNLKEMASSMYSTLFKLDTMNKKLILCYLDPVIKDLQNDPLYPGVMNRLNKILGLS
jgi:L-threonylcarbamoyladenylate synthase